MFYTTDISVTLWIINMNKKAGKFNGRDLRNRRKEVLFMDLRRWDDDIDEIMIDKCKKKKKTVLTDKRIADVKEVYNNWQSADTKLYSDKLEFCKSATLDEIRGKNYSLTPSKYIEFIDKDLDIHYETEMKRIQSEMRNILATEKQSQAMLGKAFKGIGYGIN